MDPNRLIPLLTAVLLLALPPSLVAADDTSLRIERVRIEGLERTREEVVLDLLEVEPGREIDAAAARRLEERLIKSGLFAAAEITLIEIDDGAGGSGAAELLVTVEEKWTLIPIPFFASGGDGFSGGIIFLESNLLGRNKQLVSAGFGGTAGFSGFLLYADPSLAGSDWSFSLSGSYGRSEEETTRADGERIRSTTLLSRSGGLGVGYRFGESLRAGVRFSAVDRSVEEWSPGLDERPPEEGGSLETEVSVDYDGTRPVGVLMTGPSAEAALRVTYPESGRELRLKAGIGFPLFSDHRLRVAGDSGWGDMPPLSESSISARDGFRTLPYRAVTADRWGSASLYYDLPVVTGDWGALVLSHYWEAGAYATEILDPRWFYGPGGGFRVYLRRVAIPAMGLDIAWNMIHETPVFSFALGARF